MHAPLHPRYRSLDLWRGVACLSVVFYHAASCVPEQGAGLTHAIYSVLGLGYLGVSLFFVISGYCIAASSDAHRHSERSGWEFIRRRARRIYPPFWISTACLIILLVAFRYCGSAVFDRPPCQLTEVSSLTAMDWVSNLTLTVTWLHHAVGDAPRLTNAVIWSLCYEEQFYLICFAAILLTRRNLFPVLGAITVGVTVIWLCMTGSGLQSRLSGTFVDFGWWQFACGVGVYWRLNHVEDRTLARRIDRGVLLASGVLIALFVVLAVRHGGAESYFGNPWTALSVALVFAVALVWLRPLDERLAASRIGAVLGGVGLFSYSLYLTHLPVCKLVEFAMERMGFWTPGRALAAAIPMSVLASVLVGWIFYQLVEKRFLNLLLNPTRATASATVGLRGEVDKQPARPTVGPAVGGVPASGEWNATPGPADLGAA